eukprot:6162290-Pyramimonas_sp.AAC.1
MSPARVTRPASDTRRPSECEQTIRVQSKCERHTHADHPSVSRLSECEHQTHTDHPSVSRREQVRSINAKGPPRECSPVAYAACACGAQQWLLCGRKEERIYP